MPKQILLVGGNGYLGRGMARFLEAQGHPVESWDLPREIQMLKPSDLQDFDFVVNLAVVAEATPSPGLSHRSSSWKINVEGVVHLIDVCQQAEKVLVHFSTREVHAQTLREDQVLLNRDFYQPNELIDENVKFRPVSAYGRSKLISEWLCQEAERCFVVRLGTPYTDETPSTGGGLIATLVRKAIVDGNLTLEGGGRQFRDPLHVNDISELVLLISNALPEEKVFNAGGGSQNVISLREIVARANPSCVIQESSGGDFGFAMDISLAEEKLSWKPKVDVREAIDSFVRAYAS